MQTSWFSLNQVFDPYRDRAVFSSGAMGSHSDGRRWIATDLLEQVTFLSVHFSAPFGWDLRIQIVHQTISLSGNKNTQ